MTTKKTDANNIVLIDKVKRGKVVEFVVQTSLGDKVDIRFVPIEDESELLMTTTVHLSSTRNTHLAYGLHFTFKFSKVGKDELIPNKDEPYADWLEGLLIKFFYHKEILEDKDMIVFDEEFKIMKSLGI